MICTAIEERREKQREGRTVTEARFEECIRAMNRGDRNGLKEVYEEYVSYIYGIVRALLHNKEEAEDITGDFFIRLWEKSDTYKPGGGHKGWMATIARNMAVDYIRKHKREEFSETVSDRESDENVEHQVLADISISEALATLKESERKVVHLKIMGELTFKEIAEILNQPMGTVTWHYNQAIKKLRRCGYAESGRSL